MRDPRAEEVFKFNIETPKDPKKKDGDMVPLTIRMYLGQTEIKIDTIFGDETTRQTTRQSFSFQASTPELREETEQLHHQVVTPNLAKKQTERLKPQ